MRTLKPKRAATESVRRKNPAGGGSFCACGQCEPAVKQTTTEFCACGSKDCQFCEARLYSGLPEKHLQEMRGSLSHSNSAARRILFRAGDPSTHLYVIRDGQVKLTRTDVDGHEHLLNIVGAGYFLGFDTIGNPRYSYNAETLTSTTLCRIKHDDILRLLKEEPGVALNVLLAVNEQLAQARNMINALGHKTAVEKVAALLLNLFPARAGGATGKTQALHLSRQEIAQLLGLTVETVSRIMASLRRKRIIDAPRGRIVISAHERLRALAGESPRKPSKASRPSSRRKQHAIGGDQMLRLS